MKAEQLRAFTALNGTAKQLDSFEEQTDLDQPDDRRPHAEPGEPFDEKLAWDIGNQLGVDWQLIPFDEWNRGLQDELEEHMDVTGGDLLLAGMIALAHLRKRPDYYTVTEAALEG